MANPIKLRAEVTGVVPFGKGTYAVSFAPLTGLPRFKAGQFLQFDIGGFRSFGWFLARVARTWRGEASEGRWFCSITPQMIAAFRQKLLSAGTRAENIKIDEAECVNIDVR